MKVGRYITVVIIAGFVLIAILAFITPDQMATQLPLLLAGIATACGIFIKISETDDKIEIATLVSRNNAEQLAHNTNVTEATNHIVNSQHDELVAQLKEVTAKLARVEAQVAAKATAQSHADATEARIIDAVKAGPQQQQEDAQST